jgi:DNA polymerase III delta prime subunit/energy-coupling factor transporter ATP-binding protein EcfA2
MNICATIITSTEIPEMISSWIPCIQSQKPSIVPPSKENSPEIIEKEEENTQRFKLPIQYLDKSKIHSLSDIIAKDLELYPDTPIEKQEEKEKEEKEKEKAEKDKSMYDFLFQHDDDTKNTSIFSRELLPQWKNQFTSDTDFLLQSQEMVKTIPKILSASSSTAAASTKGKEEKIKEIWNDVKNDPNFMEKYGYLEWSVLEQFNHSPNVLQAISLINIISPILSFLIPFFILIFPFILLKIKQIPITVNEYIDCLLEIARNHFIGKAIICCKSMNMQSLFYVVGSLGLYLLQMYQNTMQCIRFYRNTQHINESLITMKEYIDDSITKMNSFIEWNKNLSTYMDFCKDVMIQRDILLRLKEDLKSIQPFQCSIYKTTEIGYMLKCFYELHSNSEYEDAILYSMGFQGYLQQMNAINNGINKGTLGLAKFTTESDIIDVNIDNVEDEKSLDSLKESEESEKEESEEKEKPPTKYINNQFYPPHYTEKQCVKNNANLDKKMIITGPNASGKTTFLKTTAINLIFSQQFGVGYYSDCCIVPYTHFHSYLNIPDTSGRDSLFQAESRRCKEILDIIKTTNKYTEKHFCIFDELYSGTNPVEATKSAYAFLKYLSKTYIENVDFLLTTHYVSICDKWNKKKDIIQNYCMGVITKTKDTYIFTYKIEPGISKIQGALQILEDMEYPDEIIDTIRDTNF